MATPRKTARERYTLKPHEKRELAQLAGRRVDRKALRGLATKYGVALKVVHDVLVHHHVEVVAGEPQNRTSPAACAKKKPKLSLKMPDQEPAKEEITEAKLLARKLELDRREAELRRREDALLDRERILEQDRFELDIALRNADAAPDPQEITALNKVIDDLKQRVRVLAEERRQPSASKLFLLSPGTVKQMLLVKDAEIARLQRIVDASPVREREVALPESMMVM